MRIRVASNADAEVVAVLLTDVADKIIGVLEEIGSGSRVDCVFLFSGGIASKSKNVGDSEVFTSLMAHPSVSNLVISLQMNDTYLESRVDLVLGHVGASEMQDDLHTHTHNLLCKLETPLGC